MNRLASFSLAVLIANLGVILWGAFVRATGSGAGCGSHWPLCNGEVIPPTEAFETLVELTHRLTSGMALLLTVALVVATFRGRPAGDPTRAGSVAVLVFMLVEALVGAGIVLFELVVDDSSVARAVVMAIHLLNTFLLLAAATLTVRWADGAPAIDLRRHPERMRWLGFAFAGMLLVGTTGAIAALGDTLFPAESLQHALQQDRSGSAHWLVRLRSLHPVSAVVVGLYLIRLPSLLPRAARLTGPPPDHSVKPLSPEARRWGRWLALGVLVQLAAGTLNIFLLVPTWLQLVHLFLADMVWIALVLFAHAALTQEPEPASATKKGLDQAAPSPRVTTLT